MHQYIEHISRGSVSAPELSDWALSHGVTSLTTEDVSHLCGVPTNQVPQRLAPQRQRSRIFSPARGLWVPVPAEYRTWGAPDPLLYIDDMMRHLGMGYLVGWLTAAARHGASHQAPQTFQVATSRNLRDRDLGRSRVRFFARSYVVSAPCSQRDLANTGARVATSGMTMLMLAADPGFCGGMGNVATAIVELSEENPGYVNELLATAAFFADAAPRRVGYILEEFGGGAPDSLREYCAALTSQPSYLSPTSPKAGALDRAWNVVLNEEVDPDL
ncbi:MAG: type IV toxin-antitoxin system AbiEi family antitoxin [Coriobacteriia bacterium]|nr:type IV toxin-antitoxin system AbiEi family antitoxin [Coriobacteriia bacterium]